MPEVPGILTSAEVLATAPRHRRGAAARRHDPVVPRRPLRPVEPRRGGHGPDRVRAGRRGRWRPTAGWPSASCPTAAGSTTTRATRVKDPRLDTNVCAYLAAGAWHHHLITGDVEFLGELWPTIEAGIDFILRWQQPDGSVLWSLDSAGRPEGYALLDRVVVHLPLPALRRGRGRVPGQGPPGLGAGRRPPGPRRGPSPRRLRPQGRVRHGLVLPDALGRPRGRGGPAPPRRGVVDLRHGGPRRALRLDGGLGHGGRDGRVRAGPRRAGHGRPRPRPLRGRARTCVWPTGRTGPGWSTPRRRPFPSDERTTYTFAAMVLAADALSSTTPAAGLFRGECLPAALDLAEPHCGDAADGCTVSDPPDGPPGAEPGRSPGPRLSRRPGRPGAGRAGCRTRRRRRTRRSRARRSRARRAGARRRPGRGRRRGWPATRRAPRGAPSPGSRPRPAPRRGRRR